MQSPRPKGVLLLFLLLAPTLLGAVSARPEPTAQTHPGLSGLDASTVLLTLARDGVDPLTVLSPLQGDGRRVDVPPALLAPLDDPPPLSVTLEAMARAMDMRVGHLPAVTLHSGLDRALSVLGQGVLGAHGLVAQGENYAAAMLLREAYERARPALERDTLVLDRFGGLAFEEPTTRARVRHAEHVRTAEDAMLLAGIEPARPLEPRPLPEALATAYARLGLPVSWETRLGLAASEALDPALRGPLELSLAHLLEAWRLRDEALAEAGAVDLALLSLSPRVAQALANETPTPEDLVAIASYGAALGAVDHERLLEAAGHLVAAATALQTTMAVADLDAPCCTSENHPGERSDPERHRVSLGGIVVEFGASGRGDAVVHLGEGEAGPSRSYPDAFVAVDPSRLALVVYEDRDRNLRHDPDEELLVTPSLRSPERDVLFQDPYGLVVVSGEGATTTDARSGGRRVTATWGVGLAEPGAPRPDDALAQIDGLLGGRETRGVWPMASDLVRRESRDDRLAPSEATVVVNPAGYQILRWDLGGGDTYMTNAGGAGQRGILAVSADGVGELLSEKALAAPLPVAILVDLGGDDTYSTAENDTLAAANASLALLFDGAGKDAFRFAGLGHGLASATSGGVALLLAGNGNASYEARDAAVGYASGGGTALLLDTGGADAYRAGNRSLAASDFGRAALLVDLNGNDTYSSSAFSQGASRGGIAALLDAAGDDAYDAGGRPDAQAYSEPYAETACVAEGACPGLLGPARIALKVDGGGSDKGACPPGWLANPLVGRIGMGRAPVASTFNPAFAACVHAGLSGPATPGTNDSLAVPPTFFASSFGSFTVPGLARLGSLAHDTVGDPFLLSVDLLGSDTYGLGAVAIADASGLDRRELGIVAPVALHVDTHGDDVHDAAEANATTGGAFAFAAGGAALQATSSTRRFEVALDASRVANATDASGDWANAANATQNARLDERRANASSSYARSSPLGTHTYRNVSVGIAAAERGGVAVLLREGVGIRVEPSPSPASCRLACARTGGVAIAIGAGPGDAIVASPWSLGAVQESELGGLAVYYKRGGRDAYAGSAQSMGHVAPAPSAPVAERPEASVLAARPNVALFVKDGYERDFYAPELAKNPYLPGARGDNRHWEDRRTTEAFHAFGGRALHVAQGVDNLDWYANANVAAADGGIAPGAGPGTNRQVETPLGPPPVHYYALLSQIVDALPRAGPVNNVRSLMQVETVRGALATANATLGYDRDNLVVNAGHERGDGGSATSPEGLRPVTFARTPFNPGLQVVDISYVGEAGKRYYPPTSARVADFTEVRLQVTDPPAYADQTALETLVNRPPSATAGSVHRGMTIQRVELAVMGREPSWGVCPAGTLRDRHDPRACVVAYWDRDEHGEYGSANVTRWNYNASRSDFLIGFNAGQFVPGLPSTLLFPPGNYTLVARAYAARPHGLPGLTGEAMREATLDGLLSDALNLTDDNYGLYGSTYYVDVPFAHRPQLIGVGQSFLSSNGTSPAAFVSNVSEPVRYTVHVHPVQTDTPTEVERYPQNGSFTSLLYEDLPAFHREGHDSLRFVWNATGRPEGQYRLLINMTGRLSNATSNMTESSLFLHVDRQAPSFGLDPRAMPASLNARNSPGGNIALALNSSDLQLPASNVREVHLWVQEDVLDAADPHVVLERVPWRHAGIYTGAGTETRPNRLDGEPMTVRTVVFQGNPDPGPPRAYRFAAYVVDGAGNVRTDDPRRDAPEQEDCIELCAAFLYDITPPRTRLDLLAPAPGSGRIARGNLTLGANASETPDIEEFRTYAAVVSPEHEPLFDAAMRGEPQRPAPGVSRPNLTLFLETGERMAQPSQGLARAGEELELRLRARADDERGFSDERPVHVYVNVTDAAGAMAIPGPLVYNVTEQFPPLVGGRPGLDRTVPNVTLRLPRIELPRESGIYTIEVDAGAPTDPHSPRFAGVREGVVVWEALASPNATGAIRWMPTPEQAVHGNVVLLLARGADRAGNVEDKETYDIRLAVDLLPPRLLTAPEATAGRTGASFLLELDEPAAGRARLFNASGSEVGNATLSTFSAVHAVAFAGLAPEEDHRLALELRDELGNAANLSTFNGSALAVTTQRALDVALQRVPPTISAAVPVAWSVASSEEALLEYNLTLSLDGGRTFPYVAGTLRAVETEPAIRNLTLDPSRYPESPSARLRLAVHAVDAPEARVVLYSEPFTLDAQAPQVEAIPAPGIDAYTNASVTLRVNATDAGSGLEGVEWSADGQSWEAVGPAGLLLEGDAPRTIHVRARDKAGNVGGPRPVKLLLDRQPPALRAAAAESGPLSAAAVAVDILAEDVHAGLVEVVAFDERGEAFRLDGQDFFSGRAEGLWNLGEEDGPRTLTVAARDAAGNVAQAKLVARVDRSAPTGAFRLVERTMSTLRVVLELDEPAELAASVTSERGTSLLFTPARASREVSLEAFGLRPGAPHAFAVRARDGAGNHALLTASFSTLADLEAPGAPFPPSPTQARDGGIFLRWDAPADNGRLAHYRVLRSLPGDTPTVIATTNLTSLLDTAIVPGRTYSYQVVPVDEGGNAGAASPPVAVRSRTAPTSDLGSIRILPEPDAHGRRIAEVTLRVRDVDGDRPALRLVMRERTIPLTLAPNASGGWDAHARFEVPASLPERDRAFHVVADDGLFATREPPAGEARLPPIEGAPRDSPAGISAARRIPLPSIPLLFAALAALAFRRRTW